MHIFTSRSWAAGPGCHILPPGRVPRGPTDVRTVVQARDRSAVKPALPNTRICVASGDSHYGRREDDGSDRR